MIREDALMVRKLLGLLDLIGQLGGLDRLWLVAICLELLEMPLGRSHVLVMTLHLSIDS